MSNEPQTGNQVASPRKDGRDESSFAVTVGEVYDGPLDLLLDLIRKQDIDIYDIPIAKITEQYLKYVESMKQIDVDIAAEFIYTASLLIHIKSKMLLPRDPDAIGSIDDPRWSSLIASWSTSASALPLRCSCRSNRSKRLYGRTPPSRNFVTQKAPNPNSQPTSLTW
jgi:hypothetical protein